MEVRRRDDASSRNGLATLREATDSWDIRPASTIITNNERTDRDAFDRVLIGDRCARRKIVGWNGRVNRDRDEKWRMEKREIRFLRAGNVSPIDFVFLAISGQGWGSKL